MERYHILEQLGEGGMATVYKAYDTHLERDVAVKVILTQKQNNEKFLKRFEREARGLAQLTHPNIVGVIDYGEYEGTPYLVMVYLPSGTLKHLLGKPIPYQKAARMLSPIARALAYAHEQKIVHRDVKPSNILITQSGEPMLSDFGIAKILEGEETVELTKTGVGVGTPEYMSPEQAQGKPVDGRSDIYSLGVILFEMITGRKPYQADTPMAVVWKLASEPLPRPRQFISRLPEKVEKVLLKALAKNPEDRFRDMNEFAAVLEMLSQGNQVPIHLTSGIERKRRSILAGVLLTTAILITGFFAIMWFVEMKHQASISQDFLINATITTTIIAPTRTPIPTFSPSVNPLTTEVLAIKSAPIPISSPITISRNIPPANAVISNETLDTIPTGFHLYQYYKLSNGILSLNDPTSMGEASGDGNSRLATILPVVLGDGYLLVFQLKDNPQYFITFEYGPFNTSGYRAFWLRDTYVSVWKGTNEFHHWALSSPFVPDTWYCVVLRRYSSGIEGIYWQKDLPEIVNKFNLTTGSDWAGNNLNFNIVIMSGIVNIDEFQELDFSNDSSNPIFQ